MSSTAKAIAIGAASAVGIALIAFEIKRRLSLSSLEASVERAPSLKAAGRKALLRAKEAKQAKGSDRNIKRRSIPDHGYFAFVSHMKAEAAMEARFLQIELEALKEDELVFLDSDDLRDLTKLIDHVQKSRCLILVLTRKVLTRPYCILEVLTAIEARIPIVCVTVAGKPNDTYDFEEMSKMMLWMDSELEQWNPGAADVLRDHGYDDLTEVAYRLSTTVPNTIAVGLNTGASRNMLRATIEDVVSSVDEARAILAEKQTPGPSEKAAWLATREKQQRPVPTVKSPARKMQRATTMPSSVYAHGAGGQPAANPEPSAPLTQLAGRGLITAAASTPALLPLAFAVQALASGGSNATVQKTECANIAAAAEPLERLLLATGDKADGATLQEVNTAVEALAAMQARCGAKVAASLGPEALATLSPAAFESAKSALVTSVGGLASVSDAKGRQAAKDLACALQGLPFEAPKEEEPKADAAMTEALQASQQQAELAKQQRELVEMQNKVLMEQVAQMQQMMAQQQMTMQSFMQKFPQPADEAERRLVLLKKRLMDADRSEFHKVDDVVYNLLISGALGPDCKCVMFNVIGESEQRGLSLCLALDDGSVLGSDDLPAAFVGETTPRKASMCQYIVATGEYACHTKANSQCFAFDIMRKGIHLMKKDPEAHAAIEAVKAIDPKYNEMMSGMAVMNSVMASEEDLEELPAMRRIYTKMQRHMINGAISAAASTTNMGKLLQWMMTTMSDENTTYLGAPVKCEGRTMGSLCTIMQGGVDADKKFAPGGEVSEKLKRGAARVGAVLEELDFS